MRSWSGSKGLAFASFVAIALVVDQLVKAHVTERLEVGARRAILGDFLSFAHVPSMGGAFGFFRDWLPADQLVGFFVLAGATACIVLVFYRSLARGEQGSAAGLGLILGGLASHVVDRLRYGTGLDCLHIGSPDGNRVPDFSVADVAIVLGVATLIVELLATEMAARATERTPHRG